MIYNALFKMKLNEIKLYDYVILLSTEIDKKVKSV